MRAVAGQLGVFHRDKRDKQDTQDGNDQGSTVNQQHELPKSSYLSFSSRASL